jgi:8-hydroxy-5-deazaflavin:NADPH oxidoreductase
MKRVGIIGSGIVAKTLAAGFLKSDYEVMIGSRDLNKINDVQGVFPGTVTEAADFADLLVLAVKGTAAIKAIEKCNLDGKTIIDTTNPIADKPPVSGVLQFFTDLNTSLGEQLQAAYPKANFVKAF